MCARCYSTPWRRSIVLIKLGNGPTFYNFLDAKLRFHFEYLVVLVPSNVWYHRWLNVAIVRVKYPDVSGFDFEAVGNVVNRGFYSGVTI